MRLISIVLVIISFFSPKVQQTCNLHDFLSIYFLDKIEYTEYEEDIDLSPLFFTEKTYAGTAKYLSFIGNNKKRLNLEFFAIKKSKEGVYEVSGQTTVFNGVTRKFEGNFILKEQCIFDNEQLAAEESYEHEVKGSEIHGFSVLEFTLLENKQLSSTGIFEGDIFVLWYKNKEGQLLYNDIQGYIPSYTNCIFNGHWTSYRTKKKSIVAWSHYRIPCAGDLDIGVSEFMPNEKYYKYGWADYKP
ncbi:MAG: hypothetical protein L3J23_07130 [Flavobacteriaceae bacterium]|nr:hypothetical protein [Flavobacteriaceae bacterium]